MAGELAVGIAGYGVVGRRRRLVADAIDGMMCVAVCDRALPPGTVDGIPVFFTYEELLAQELDVLLVCMSNDMAAEVTRAGLARDLHVFCEKPPARCREELVPVLAEEARHPHRRLAFGFNHRYHDSVQEALALRDSGELGDVISLRGAYGKSQLTTFDQSDWRTNWAIAGGGVLLDQGIHLVDLMRLFGGEFTSIHSFISNAHWGHDVEDNVFAIMRSDAGVVASLVSSATQWRHRFSLEVTLTRGSLILEGILSGSKSYGAETLTVIRADPTRDRGDPPETRTTYTSDPSWDREMRAFHHAILTGEPLGHGDSRDAMLTLDTVMRIYEADVTWQPHRQSPLRLAPFPAVDA